MSKHPEHLRLSALWILGTVVAATSIGASPAWAAPLGAPSAAPVPTVTLAEYRNAQRIALDAEARKKIEGASTVAAQQSVGAIPVVPAIAPGAVAVGASAPILVPKVPAAPPEPRIAISGLAAIKGEWRAEISTEFGVHVLRTGEQIPGTEWLVGPIRPERVTLLKPERRLRSGKLAREQVRTLALGQELL